LSRTQYDGSSLLPLKGTTGIGISKCFLFFHRGFHRGASLRGTKETVSDMTVVQEEIFHDFHNFFKDLSGFIDF